MANTVHGPYAPTTYTTAMTKGDATNLETQAGVALHSFNPDLISAAFVQLPGVACVKDVTTASQLNVTAGVAYLIMTDGTLARIDIAATTFSSSGHPSTTLYLDLNPDGTWSFATTHSAQANALPICQVTTDGSSNLSGVTDKRVSIAHLLTSAPQSGVALPTPLVVETTQSALLAATVYGGVTFGQTGALRGGMNGAALFNGTSGYISIPPSGLPTGNSSVTLEIWVKLSANPSSVAIPLGYGGGAGKDNIYLQVNTSGTVQVSGLSAANAPSSALSLNTWHHLVGVYDASAGKVSCFVDGVSTGAAVSVSAPNFLANDATISLAPFGVSNYVAGWLDEAALYSTALAATRITAHYNAGISTTSDAYAATTLADTPARYYRLGEAVGVTSVACTSVTTTTTLVDAGGALGGGLLVDSENGNTVARTSPPTAQFILQINGHNFTLDASGGLTVPGALVSAGGQASAGSLGVPVVVAQAINVHVTVTTQVTILTYTPYVTGMYVISTDFWCAGPPNISSAPFTGNYTSGFTGGGSPGPGWTYFVSMYAAAGQPITVSYRNSNAGANDYVGAVIARLT